MRVCEAAGESRRWTGKGRSPTGHWLENNPHAGKSLKKERKKERQKTTRVAFREPCLCKAPQKTLVIKGALVERDNGRQSGKKIRFDKALHKCETCAQGEREELLSKSKQS